MLCEETVLSHDLLLEVLILVLMEDALRANRTISSLAEEIVS